MKPIFRFVVTFSMISIIVSCASQIKTFEIEGRWKVDSVVKLESGKIAPDMNAYFNFRPDSTVISENEVLGRLEANWIISENKIKMIQNQDTTVFTIEKLTGTEMILISDLGEGDLKFKLLKQ